jgi:hypothetical protein
MALFPFLASKSTRATPEIANVCLIVASTRNRKAHSGSGFRNENGNLLAAYDIELDENGCLKSSHMLKEGETGKNVWYAYVESSGNSPWFNGQTYVDTLSKSAIAHFIDTTHEVYKAKIGDKFGSVVPCIFTDEPEFSMLIQLSSPKAKDDGYIPWTYDLPETFKKEYSADIIESLPELFWDLPDGEPSLTRYRWHDHNCERFVSAFMDQIGQWCEENGLMLNGHMMEEPYLWSQTHSIGEAMRCYRNMQMPGMDLLQDQFEYNTAKQVTSVSRQNGARGAMTEIYGVTHWYFTFEGHKGCGDWQAALGITFRVHHLTWVSMAGEGKRDYPACIGYQSPWYKEYGYVEDHFARIGVVLTRGKAVTKVGVIHPIESYWLSWGPNRMGDERDRREQAFAELTRWLLHGLIDFDFISESMLPSQVGKKQSGMKLAVGKCEYDVIILPNLRTIRCTTLKILQDFTKAGGKVIIAGNAPTLVDAKVPRSAPVIEHSKSIFWSQQSILLALDVYRDIQVSYQGGSATDKLLYQMRQDGDERFVFICNTDRNSPIETVVHLKGFWKANLMDTLSGEEYCLKTQANEGWTDLPYRFEGCASLLLRLSPKSDSAIACLPLRITYDQDIKAASEIILDSIELSEPNVLLLDYAEFKLDNGEWSGLSEVLRIDNIIRGQLHLPYKGQGLKQPWTIPQSERAPITVVTLRFNFESAFDISETIMLALEDAETKIIYINDTFVPSTNDMAPLGWWVDESIKTVPVLGHLIKKGTNIVTLTFPFGLLTNLERIYLLGKFAVDLQDHRTTLLQPLNLNKVNWGDITSQGLPFYVGNITYKCTLLVPSDATARSSQTPLALSVSQFSSPVLTVIDLKTNKELGRIAFQPHILALGKFKTGCHNLAITAFGNRFNSFGHLHVPEGVNQCDPNMWRTGGDLWSDKYSIRPIGVLKCPTILVGQEEVVDDIADVEMADDLELREGYGEWVTVSRAKPQEKV